MEHNTFGIDRRDEGGIVSYTQRVIDQVKAKDPDQPKFIQAVTEVLTSLEPVIAAHPEYEEAALLERII